MAVSAEQKSFVLELFAGVGHITSHAMMGGMTFYADGQVFAILGSDGQIYLKAKDAFAQELAQEGSSIFAMEVKGVTKSMGYWTLPDAALDDPDTACDWGRRALKAAYPEQS